MARTVDHVSGGRLILGIGSGWFQRDYDEYGFEFGTAPGRLRDLKANMPIIKDRWAQLNPPPTRDIPVLIGGDGERVTLRIVAEHADIWQSFGNVETMQRKSTVPEKHCATLGRDYAEIERSASIRWDRGATTEVGDELYEIGFRQFTFGVGGPTYELGFLEEWLAWRDAKNSRGVTPKTRRPIEHRLRPQPRV